jgi:putative ABC transport system permease protein
MHKSVMNLPTRWIKIIKDTWSNRSRSLLVVLSIAVGVASVGMINNAGIIVRRDLFGAFAAGHPASLHISISPFQKGLASAVAAMPEVERTQPRQVASALILKPKGQWVDLGLNAFPDLGNVSVDQVDIQSGTAQVQVRQIVLERQSAAALGLGLGDRVQVKKTGENNDRIYELQVVGIAHDLYNMPYNLLGEVTGYVSLDTLVWMGFPNAYNRLDVVVSQTPFDRQHVLDVGDQIRDQVVQPVGYTVTRIAIPGLGSSNPGKHWGEDQINGFLLILQIMGIMAILLSSGLVVNTVSAMLVQQVRQIGIMRSIGAQRRQLIGMYLANVFVFCVLGLLIALPLGLIGGWWLSDFAAGFVNFNVSRLDVPINVLLLQVALGLIMPLSIALFPILRGTQMTIYDAIYQHGIGGGSRQGWFDGVLMRLKGLTPPVLLALRNTFRNKARLGFTLTTLTLAGAMFVAVFSTRASLSSQLDQIGRYVRFDVALGLPPNSNAYTAEREARRLPGVTIIETWAYASGVLVRQDGSESQQIELVGLKPADATIDPWMIQGRWLLPSDTHGVVVNNDLLRHEAVIGIGDSINLKVGNLTRTFKVVGITSNNLSGPRIYMNTLTFEKLTDRYNQADMLRLRASAQGISSRAIQDSLAKQVETRFTNAGLSQATSITNHAIFGDFTKVFDLILVVLMIMAALLAVVGGLGLTGSLGINVLERTREIGVLRAVGASNLAVRKVIVIEGVAVGLLSWILGALVSGPVGRALSGAVITAVMTANLSFKYSFPGLFIWLGVVGLIGVFASLAPARRAASLTVREVLDYE